MASKLSYATAASRSIPDATASRASSETQSNRSKDQFPTTIQQPRKRSVSPKQRPKTSTTNETVYVLTLLTDRQHHDRMTGLRKRYFPRELNKLDAHLTLFHALPESELESSICPVIQKIADKTFTFPIHAAKPFRMKKGIAIGVSKQYGGDKIVGIRRALQKPWLTQGFLSDQDSGDSKAHYTIMNKVDDAGQVDQAWEEVETIWKNGPDAGTAEGLGLFKYDRGWWKFERRFDFQKI